MQSPILNDFPGNELKRKLGGANRKTQPAPEAKKAKANSKSAQEESSDGGLQYWLMKAEPETRVVKGVDVKFR